MPRSCARAQLTPTPLGILEKEKTSKNRLPWEAYGAPCQVTARSGMASSFLRNSRPVYNNLITGPSRWKPDRGTSDHTRHSTGIAAACTYRHVKIHQVSRRAVAAADRGVFSPTTHVRFATDPPTPHALSPRDDVALRQPSTLMDPVGPALP
ncbi:hypothetical protein Cs7R123_79430 [Catellatospora sp. TT07R-123]|nr:hypothetical protein Cs7R123_79430 [Catellatospora sp. TT07R-123]